MEPSTEELQKQYEEAKRMAITPHAYVATGVPQWRTCKVCGRGANAIVHHHV